MRAWFTLVCIRAFKVLHVLGVINLAVSNAADLNCRPPEVIGKTLARALLLPVRKLGCILLHRRICQVLLLDLQRFKVRVCTLFELVF